MYFIQVPSASSRLRELARFVLKARRTAALSTRVSLLNLFFFISYCGRERTSTTHLSSRRLSDRGCCIGVLLTLSFLSRPFASIVSILHSSPLFSTLSCNVVVTWIGHWSDRQKSQGHRWCQCQLVAVHAQCFCCISHTRCS